MVKATSWRQSKLNNNNNNKPQGFKVTYFGKWKHSDIFVNLGNISTYLKLLSFSQTETNFSEQNKSGSFIVIFTQLDREKKELEKEKKKKNVLRTSFLHSYVVYYAAGKRDANWKSKRNRNRNFKDPNGKTIVLDSGWVLDIIVFAPGLYGHKNLTGKTSESEAQVTDFRTYLVLDRSQCNFIVKKFK